MEFFCFENENEFYKALEYFRVDRCDVCNETCELVECETMVIIADIRLDFSDALIMKCIKCGKVFMPMHFAKMVAYVYHQAIEGGYKGGTFPRTSYKKEYDYCKRIGFTYDYRDHINIPGLCHDDEHTDGFLTPVYFEKTALVYFIASPEYEVNIFSESYGDIRKKDIDGALLWVIAFGFNSNGRLVFWLGDLDEMDDKSLMILKGFNIESDHKIVNSEFYQAQMNCIFSAPIVERQIITNKKRFIENALEQEKIDLNHLVEECDGYENKLCRPVIYTQDSVSEQVNLLDKILVEGISVPGLKEYYEALYEPGTRNAKYKKEWQSIKLIEEILRAKCPVNVNVSEIMTPLYLLHDYRILADHLLSTEKVENYKEHIVSCLCVNGFEEQEKIYIKLLEGLNRLFQLLSVI